MKKIIIANQKGGIGKSTTATAMASILTSKGYRTLLIDADKQGNSSDTYRAKIEGESTLFDVLLDEEPIPLTEAVQKTENGDIVASDPLLRKADKILYDDVDGLFRLSEALDKASDHYDYVVIDTAPSIDSILNNCLIAADYVVIPITADRYAIQGLAQLNEAIRAIKKRNNPGLQVAGLLLVMHNDRTRLSRDVRESLEKIAEQMDTKLYRTAIRETVRVQEAQVLRETLIKYDPKCTAAEDYISFVDEFLEGDK